MNSARLYASPVLLLRGFLLACVETFCFPIWAVWHFTWFTHGSAPQKASAGPHLLSLATHVFEDIGLRKQKLCRYFSHQNKATRWHKESRSFWVFLEPLVEKSAFKPSTAWQKVTTCVKMCLNPQHKLDCHLTNSFGLQVKLVLAFYKSRYVLKTKE